MKDWIRICALRDIPRLGARVVPREAGSNIAIFRNAEDQVFAIDDHCPHRGGPLSQGIMFGRHVACPLHSLQIDLESGEAVAPDTGCVKRYPVKVTDGILYLDLAVHASAAC